MRQRLYIIGILVGGLSLAALIVATGPDIEVQEPQQRIASVPTMPVSIDRVQITVGSQGTVAPKVVSDLVAEVPGRIVAVAPSMVAGGFFARDDVLVRIESVDYEAGLEEAAARLASARSELTNAERHYDRHQELAVRESVSQSQFDDARNRLTVAEAALRRAVIGQAQAERDLSRTRLTAPYAGRVRAEGVDVGQFVQRGEVVATLYSIEAAEVLLPIRDEDLAFLPVSLTALAGDAGEPPRVLLRARFAGGERDWEGAIVRTEGELDPATRMMNLIARVEAPYQQAGGPPMVAGLFVQATIFGNWYDGIAAVPRSALQAGNRVYVVGPGNRIEFRTVDVLRVENGTALLRGGLRDGETICVSTLRDVHEGQQVRPMPADRV